MAPQRSNDPIFVAPPPPSPPPPPPPSAAFQDPVANGNAKMKVTKPLLTNQPLNHVPANLPILTAFGRTMNLFKTNKHLTKATTAAEAAKRKEKRPNKITAFESRQRAVAMTHEEMFGQPFAFTAPSVEPRRQKNRFDPESRRFYVKDQLDPEFTPRSSVTGRMVTDVFTDSSLNGLPPHLKWAPESPSNPGNIVIRHKYKRKEPEKETISWDGCTSPLLLHKSIWKISKLQLKS